MAVTDLSVRNVKVFPEVIPITAAQATLAAGNTDMIRIWQNPDKSKVVKGLDFNFDAVDNVNLRIRSDSDQLDPLHTNSLPGTDDPFHVEAAHEMYWARDQVTYSLSNNTGGGVSNYRSGARILVDALSSADKIIMGYPLDKRDLEAIDILKKELKIDVYEQVALGVHLPHPFNDFLEIHEVKGPFCLMEALPQGTNLATGVATDIINRDIDKKGEEAFVVESLWIQRLAATDITNVTITINRDDDLDYIQLDPACFPENTAFNGNMNELNLHVHAFDNIHITATQNGGTHNSYKAAVGLSRRKLGVAFKAKMLEFQSKLPKNLDISSAEQDLIDSKRLMELIRTGMYEVG